MTLKELEQKFDFVIPKDMRAKAEEVLNYVISHVVDGRDNYWKIVVQGKDKEIERLQDVEEQLRVKTLTVKKLTIILNSHDKTILGQQKAMANLRDTILKLQKKISAQNMVDDEELNPIIAYMILGVFVLLLIYEFIIK